MKHSFFVCLIVGVASLSPAQELSPRVGDSANVQHLVKFSGTLPYTRGFIPGMVALHFKMYDEPYGGAAYWQETQNAPTDAQGRYTILLGDSTLGGLPAEIFEPGKVHWLAVQVSGQPEQPRILLVGLPATSQSDPIRSSGSVSESATRMDPTERYITLLLSTMFMVGVGLTYIEARKWWKARMEQYGPPPFANLLSSIPSRDRLQHGIQALRSFLAEGFRAIRGGSQRSIESIGQSLQSIDDDRPNTAA